MNILTNYKYYLNKYKYYVYPMFVFLILFFILLVLKIFQDEAINLVEEEKKIPVITKVIYPKEIRPQLLFFGRITGKNEINIVSRLSGKIVFVSKKLFNSDEVQKGEVLLKIDPFEFEQDIISKKALLDELKIELDKTNLILTEATKQLKLAEEDYKRKKKLFGNTVSQKALDDAALKVSKAKTQFSQEDFKINSIKVNLKQAEANLKVAKKKLSFTEYKAPFIGKVTNNVIDIGSEIKSGEFLGKLINTSELEAKFFVGETKFTELGTNRELKGKKIKIRWDKSKFKKFYEAEIIRIDSVISEELAGLNMYARLDDISENDPIRPGVFIEVLFEGNVINNAIKVPENAVYEEKYVYFLNKNNAVRVEVKVEGYIDNQLIITGAFLPGTEIILTRLDNFQNTNNYYSKKNN